MADTETKLKPSYGYFDVTGYITLNKNSFLLDQTSKKNENYTYSRIDLQFKDDDGNTFFLNSMDGFDSVKGKTIYVRDTTGDNMDVSFADRKNPTIFNQVDARSMVSVALTREEPDDKGYRAWKYVNFLAFYDAIKYLSTRLETGMKLRVTGQTRYNTYNGETQKNFIVNNIFLLDEKDERPTGFTFRQNVILKPDAVDLSEWDEKGIAAINANVLNKSHGNFELLPLPLTLRSDPDKKSVYKRVIDKFLTVDEDKVRRINLEGKYHRGFVTSPVTEEDLPEDAKELIEDGLYSKEEVLKMNANRETVDEMIVTRPVLFKRRDSNKPEIDFSDDEIKPEDLDALDTEVPWDDNGNAKEGKKEDSPDEDDDLSFLDDLG